MAAADLAALREQAEELGLLGKSAAPSLGLWEDVADPNLRALSVHMLRAIAEVNVGVAFHLHQLALARTLQRELGLPVGARTAPCLQGVWGLGRSALPRWLRGQHLGADDSDFLLDYFACAAPRALLLQVGDEWDSVLLPLYDGATQQLAFGVFARESLEVVRGQHAHGLDELGVFSIVRRNDARCEARAAASAVHTRKTYALGMAIDALGLLALGVGALDHAQRMARQYAAMRVQGGALIERHPAVQELLGSARTSALAVGAMLDAVARLPLGEAMLPAVLAARAQAHPLLCAGANDALQVFGGLGYLRETGLEKLVRDQNTLRVLRGSPADLRRFVAEWERP